MSDWSLSVLGINVVGFDDNDNIDNDVRGTDKCLISLARMKTQGRVDV